MVCGRPGLLVVVEVTCGRRGGTAQSWWLRWWLWDEERRRVTICDACEFGSTFERARVITLTREFVVYITCTALQYPLHNFVVSTLNFVVSAFWHYNNLQCPLFLL